MKKTKNTMICATIEKTIIIVRNIISTQFFTGYHTYLQIKKDFYNKHVLIPVSNISNIFNSCWWINCTLVANWMRGWSSSLLLLFIRGLVSFVLFMCVMTSVNLMTIVNGSFVKLPKIQHKKYHVGLLSDYSIYH